MVFCRKYYIVVVAMLMCWQGVWGQTDSITIDTSLLQTNPASTSYAIRGTVKDKKTGEAIQFATIAFKGAEATGTAADLDGNFELIVDTLPSDTLIIQALGYNPIYRELDSGERNIQLYITLETTANKLNEVVVVAGEDPAILLLKKVIAHKPVNNPDKTENYRYEAYNKIEIDLLNLDKKQFESLPVPYLRNLSYIYDNMATTEDGDKYLPFFLTEALSDYYFQRKPKKTKELIKATHIRGVNNNSINTYLGTMNLDINPYDNYMALFDKKFVSPISNAGPTFYKYKIIDTQSAYGHKIIILTYEPLRKGENCFSGTIRIVDSVYALEYVFAEIPKEANINWVKGAEFYKQYGPIGDSLWFCIKENFTAKFLPPGNTILKPPGFIARKTTSYKNIVVDDAKNVEMVNSNKLKPDVVLEDTAREVDPETWVGLRHEKLNTREQSIYNMFDTLEQDPKYTRFRNFAKVMVTGVIKAGPVEFGPYWNTYSYNQVEGHRFRFSMGTTPKLFKDIYLNGYVAYGTNDKRFKYSASGLWLLDRQPRSYVFASYTADIDRTVNYYDKVSYDNIFSVAIRKAGVPPKFIFAKDARLEYYKEYYSGFSHMLTFLRKEFDPYSPLPDIGIFKDEGGHTSDIVTNTEVNIRLRYAYKEKFLEGNYYRTSLGSKYPIVEFRYVLGLKGVLNGGYDYQKMILTVSDNIRIAPFGSIYVNIFGGKYFGTLPYPLLEAHPGNEFYAYNKYAFNMMTQYEFISDQYAGFNVEHSLGGGLFNYIPLIKKLKFRQFWTAKGVIGSLSDANKQLNLDKGFTFRTLEGNPYLELGTGVENILKLFRIDFVWRVTPRTLPNETQLKNFGIFGSVKFTF